MFTQLELDKLRKERDRYERLKQLNGTPKLPKTNKLYDEIVKIVKQQGGIIAGSYALRVHNPKYKRSIGDIDVISNNPQKFAHELAIKLNFVYNSDRFRVQKWYNSYRVYDRKSLHHVVDVVQYPIQKNKYKNVNGVKVVKPEFVFAGKKRKVVTKKGFTFPTFTFPKMRRLF